MGIRKIKPTSNGKRQVTFDDFKDITKDSPSKKLTISKKRTNGRNNRGIITIRHRGGGAKRRIRLVDFKRDKFDIPAKVESIEYDPGRGARIASLLYTDGERRYIIAPANLKVDVQVLSSKKLIEIEPGNAMPVEFIPAGVSVYNVELVPGKGGQIARGAGNVLLVMGVEKKYAQVKMPSGEIRLISKDCMCTIGQASNPDKRLISIGKAGRKRHLGWRPTVRGTAMNPNDHPHGGGEGKQSIGLKYPKTPWGKHAIGVRTRKKKSYSSKYIIQRRAKRK
jgi:large subunit ribosomal protein L2